MNGDLTLFLEVAHETFAQGSTASSFCTNLGDSPAVEH